MNKPMKKDERKAVVFGGSGFLGSHVADALTDEGFQVTIFDRQQSPYLQKQQNMVLGDIMDLSDILKVMRNVDVVYHFAGIADINEANEKPLEAVKYNIMGTSNILEVCKQANVSRFIFASTVYVYSEHGGFYRSTKQACELLIENYSKLHGLDFTILRFGSLYGKRANEFNWIHTIIRQALTEGKMQRKGDGEEIRDYIHVKDAARACVTILDEQYENHYLILTGIQAIKVKDLLRMIGEMLGDQVDIEYLDERIEEHYEITPYTFRPRLAKKFLQKTQLDLGQGILNTIYEVYKELNNSDDDKPIISLPD
jgi:UDP-glucose 4-epimerase|tara:strand:+ start:743 stop:1678 length:936 start_codon:yes stop_codon:yes gene_type:complete